MVAVEEREIRRRINKHSQFGLGPTVVYDGAVTGSKETRTISSTTTDDVLTVANGPRRLPACFSRRY